MSRCYCQNCRGHTRHDVRYDREGDPEYPCAECGLTSQEADRKEHFAVGALMKELGERPKTHGDAMRIALRLKQERDEAREVARFCRMILHAEDLGENLSEWEAKCDWLVEGGE